MVEMIIMLMTRTSPARSEVRRRLTEGLLWGWHGILASFLGWEDGSQHERRPNSCIGMKKAEKSLIIRKMASLGTPQIQRNGVTLIPTSHGLTTQGAYGLLWAQMVWTHSVTRAQHCCCAVVVQPSTLAMQETKIYDADNIGLWAKAT
jgi:hypothetical protein